MMDPIQSNNTQTTDPPEGKDFSRYVLLSRAALKGDWKTVKKLVDEHPDARTAQINEFGTTLLHLAVRKDESMWLVEDIVNVISQPSLLEEADLEGMTALSYAVISGNIKAATKLLEKNEGLLLAKDKHGNTPLNQAARFYHQELFKFLLSKTKDMETDLLSGESGAKLFICLISAKMYGIALDTLKQHMQLDENHLVKESVLITLARKPQEFASGNHNLNYWQRLIYQWIPVTNSEEKDYSLLSIVEGDVDNLIESSTNYLAKFTNSGFFQNISNGFGKGRHSFWNTMKRVTWINHIHDKKLRHMQALELVKLICKAMTTLTYGQARQKLQKPLFIAISFGIVEFVNEITEAFPDSASFINDDDQTIFHFAFFCRQEHVFKTINKMDHSKYFMTNFSDKQRNNILHLAGKSQPSSRIPGAALQMQRELQWFKAIENIVIDVRPALLEGRNEDNLTPREVFTKEHKQLVNEGTKWMKDIAQSYIVVTALIITVTFAAAFTIPGGTNEKGLPINLHDLAFTTFVISDAAALIFSCTSVLMYLGVLTSRYSEEDFLMSLPTKLIWGLITLYISIGCMMVAFYATLNTVIHHPKKHLFFSIVTSVSLAVFLFTSLQFPLLFEILRSTYGPSLLQPNKTIINSFAHFKK